jgi:hypothetical protein
MVEAEWNDVASEVQQQLNLKHTWQCKQTNRASGKGTDTVFRRELINGKVRRSPLN